MSVPSSTPLDLQALLLAVRAELLGLRWSSAVLDAAEGRYPTLKVAETLQRVNGELRFVPPKTRRSRRVVPLPPVCVDALRTHLDRQGKHCAEVAKDWRDHDLSVYRKQNADRVSAGRRLVSPAKSWWPGAGSNRRPSAFQV